MEKKLFPTEHFIVTFWVEAESSESSLFPPLGWFAENPLLWMLRQWTDYHQELLCNERITNHMIIIISTFLLKPLPISVLLKVALLPLGMWPVAVPLPMASKPPAPDALWLLPKTISVLGESLTHFFVMLTWSVVASSRASTSPALRAE